ncbi:MAG: hypothetical protein JWL60_422 [Gemmatimonadetes bacterium]|jgi:hypothetical protein|nr:hypothetical protein [Gemmatimonadota bacterium]
MPVRLVLGAAALLLLGVVVALLLRQRRRREAARRLLLEDADFDLVFPAHPDDTPARGTVAGRRVARP